MANIKLSQNSHSDYIGSMYFKAFGCVDMEFTPKPVTMKNGATVVLLHIEGTNANNGLIVNVDLWPSRNQTTKDIEKMPKKFEDIMFRIGYHTEKDIATGEEKTIEGQPKFLGYFVNGEKVFFSGDRKEFEDDWTNEEPVKEEE